MRCAKCGNEKPLVHPNGFVADALCWPCRSQIMFDREARYLVEQSVRLHSEGKPAFDALLAFATRKPKQEDK